MKQCVCLISIKHKSGKLNRGADALFRRYLLINSIQVNIVGLEFTKECYLQDGYLFKGLRVCIPKHSVPEFLIQENHEGG